MCVYSGGAGEARFSSSRLHPRTPSPIHTKTRQRWKQFEGPHELPPLLSRHPLRSQKSQRHEARPEGRSDPRRRPILLLHLPPNKSVPKPKNRSRKPTGTQSPTVSVANRAEKSRGNPPSQPLTSFKPNPTLIRFLACPSRGARVCSFLPGVQAILDSSEWETTSLANFTSL